MLSALTTLMCLAPAWQDAQAKTAGEDRPGEHWLVTQQRDDGSWGGAEAGDVRLTALVTLRLIDDNSDLTSGTHQARLRSAADWLMAQQGEDLLQLSGTPHALRVVDHAMGTIALLELLACSEDRALRHAATRWVTALEFARSPSGGWPAGPELQPDAQTTGWALLALRLAEHTGITVSRRALREGFEFERRCFDEPRGLLALSPGTQATGIQSTALLLLSSSLGEGLEGHAWLARARAALVDAGPAACSRSGEQLDRESLYLGTLACYSLGGPEWTRWSKGLKPLVQATRPPDQPEANCWWGLTASTYYRFTHVIVR